MRVIGVPIVIDKKNEKTMIVNEKVYDCNDYPYETVLKGIKIVGNKRKYYNVSASFDIESTTIVPDSEDDKPYGFMYHWQICINNIVCFGRRWEEFIKFTNELMDNLDNILVIYVQFLGYEFQFMSNFFEWDKIFATDKRAVVTAVTQKIEYRCSYRLSNMSLQKFCENSKLCVHYKLDGDKYDYRKLRTAEYEMTEEELAYCYNDVRGLCECIDSLLLDDTIATIPLTSTGYCRRDAREAVLDNPDNKRQMQSMALSPFLYAVCKTASRGGNTHAAIRYSREVLEDVYSIDIKSSYPYVMLAGQFPMSKFRQVNPAKLDESVRNYACLIDITYSSIRMKSLDGVAYISKAKCTEYAKPRIDNGRVLSADYLRMIITDVDFRIIEQLYTYDILHVDFLYTAEYGYLPYEFRLQLSKMFVAKCELETGDEYLYAKFKNKINAYFGMMLTDICHANYIYNEYAEEHWIEQPVDIAKALDTYYSSWSSFLSYQHGIWVTANARARLQDGIDIAGRDFVYCDTDSVKSLRNLLPEVEYINKRVLESESECGVSIHGYGKNGLTYCGIWDDDGHYSKFRTLGAKKYAYIKEGESKLHITVSGLNKKDGADWFQQNGGIDAFKPFKEGVTIPSEYSGRTVSYYNDVSRPYYIEVDGCRMLTASNIGVVDTTYTLGIAPEYATLLDDTKYNFDI